MFQMISKQISENGAKSAQAFKGLADSSTQDPAKMNAVSSVGKMNPTSVGNAPTAGNTETTKADEKPLETKDTKVDTPDTKVETETPKEAPAPTETTPTLSHDTNPFIKKPME